MTDDANERRRAASAVARQVELMLGLEPGRLRIQLVGDDLRGVNFVATPPLSPEQKRHAMDLLGMAQHTAKKLRRES